MNPSPNQQNIAGLRGADPICSTRHSGPAPLIGYPRHISIPD
jgi:hypothetical protein